MTDDTSLTPRQQSIVAIAALTASGDLERLKPALEQGLDAGLSEAQMDSFIQVLSARVDEQVAQDAKEVLASVLSR